MPVGPDNIKCLAAEIHEVMEFIRRFVTSIDDVSHVSSQHERRSIPFNVAKLLSIAEEFTKIDMEEMTGGLKHNIIVVSVTDAKDVSRDAVASAGRCKVLDGSLVLEG